MRKRLLAWLAGRDETPLAACSVCARPVSSSDLDCGEAIVVLRRAYCGPCRTDAVARRRRPVSP